jgi:hypothetical protein
MWLSGFRLILRSLCLPERYNHALLAYRSLLRLVSYVSIRLKNWRVCLLFSIFLLIFSLVSGISPVLADGTPTPPTPTPTDENLYNTPTPLPTNWYTCNVGKNPTGYGTITPDAVWADKCYQCITRTPYYTWATATKSPWETWTPVPPTPTITATPSPTGYPFGVYVFISDNGTSALNNITVIPEFSYHQYKTFTSYSAHPSGWIDARSNSVGSTYKIGYILSNLSHVDANAYSYYQAIKIQNRMSGAALTVKFTSDSWKNPGQTITVNANTTTTIAYWVNLTGWGAYDLRSSSPIKFDVTVNGNSWGNSTLDYTVTSYGGDLGNSATRYWDMYSIVQIGGIVTTTPTPQPTANTSYCASVKPAPTQNEIDAQFSLPKITVGWARCVSLGGWTIPMGWTSSIGNFPDITIPGFEVCAKPIKFGSMSILGLSINLDLLATVLAGIFLIRLVTRS